MYEDPKSKISQLEKVLDAREDKVTKKIKRHELHDHKSTIPQDWDDSEFAATEGAVKKRGVGFEVNPAANNINNNSGFSGGSVKEVYDSFDESGEKKRMSFSLKILLGSVVFFLIALGVVAYQFLAGGNIVSGDNIEVTVKAPVSVAGGEILPIEIEVKNNNSVTLSGADLGITFPVGAMQADNTALPVKREQVFLGDILPGQSVKENRKIVLFGAENEKKDINLSLEYKVAGSNSLFNKTKAVTVLVTSAPVSLVISGPEQVNSNQAVSFDAVITSNSSSVIKNLLLKVDYPFGFTFGSSDPTTFSKNNLWLIGDLAPGEKRTIKISGTVSGQEGEERGFTFNLGSQSTSDVTLIDTPFTSSFSSVVIRRPFVSADILFNGTDTAEYTTTAGQKVEAIIKWRNNLPYQVSDVAIEVKLSGNAIDKSSVLVEDGFYRSIDNTIIFNKTTNKIFASLDPGQEGESKFTLKSFSASSITGSGLSNPSIALAISVQGKTINNNGVPQTVVFSDARKIKVSSNPRLFAKSLYFVGPFQNKGPIPPKAETETSYTITWTVTNPLNNLSGGRVTATLPPYVKWLETVSPGSEKISYDKSTGQLVWNIGNIAAGAGSVSPAREVSFQVSLLPSVSQIGEAPDLVGEATLTARDAFTSSTVSSIFDAINTNLNNDPYYTGNGGNVVK